MKEKYFLNNGKYEILVKEIIPEKGIVNKAVVVVHGLFGDQNSIVYEQLGELLAKQNIVTVSFDLPEHGESPAKRGSFSLENCLRDIAAVENQVGQKYNNIPISFFSTSFGGYLTLLHAAAGKKNYDSIVLKAPAVKMDKTLMHIFTEENKVDEFVKAGSVKHGNSRIVGVPYEFYEDCLNHDVFELSDKLKGQKITVIQGEKDDTVLLEDVRSFCDILGENCGLTVVENADHRFRNEGDLQKTLDIATKSIINESESVNIEFLPEQK